MDRASILSSIVVVGFAGIAGSAGERPATTTTETFTPFQTIADNVTDQPTAIERLVQEAMKSGTVTVIVALKLPEAYTAEAQLPTRAAIQRQRAAIAQAHDALLASLPSAKVTEYARWDPLPLVGLEVDADALRLVAGSSLVTTVHQDGPARTLAPEQLAEIVRLSDKAARTGTVNVIVTLKLPEPYAPEPQLPDAAAIERQRAAIAKAREAVLSTLGDAKATAYGKWDPLPLLALRVDAAALRRLAESSLITALREDALSKPQ